MISEKEYEILLVEDNVAQAHIFEIVLQAGPEKTRLRVVSNGQAALEFLQDKSFLTVRPDLIFMDLHMPQKRGHDLLKEVKEDPELKQIPIIILTSSNRQEDIEKAYNFNANCYIEKPLNFEEYVKIVQSIKKFWLKKYSTT